MKQRISKRLLLRVLLLFFLAVVVGGTSEASAEYRTLTAKLKHKTPLWYQTKTDSGYPVSCGNAAWAIVYGYWKQYKGKHRLLEGVNMPYNQSGGNDPNLKKAMEEIAGYTESTYGTYKGKKWGRTLPKHMIAGKKYAEKRGYRVNVERIRGTEFNKFDKVRRWIDADKPVIILINDPKKAFSSLHYPIIEEAYKKQKKVMGKWRNRDVWYHVNMAWASKVKKDIWVREKGGNDHPHTGSFSMFLIDIQ